MLISVMSNSSSAASSTWATASRRSMTSGGSVPRPVSRRTSSGQLGGARKTSRASGTARRTCRAPARSISSRAGCLRPVSRRAARAGCHTGTGECGPFEEFTTSHHPVEVRIVRRSGSRGHRLHRAAAPVWSPIPRARFPGIPSAARPPQCSCRPRKGRKGQSAWLAPRPPGQARYRTRDQRT